MFGKFFLAWRDETSDQKRLQELIQVFFSMCIHRMRLSPQAVMAYFNVSDIFLVCYSVPNHVCCIQFSRENGLVVFPKLIK